MFKRSKSVENYQEAIHTRNKNAIAALNELMKDTGLIRHRKTLDDISKVLTRASENDQKWSTRCQKLQDQIASNELKVKTAIRLSEEDKHVIDTLKKELQSTWGIIEEFHAQNNGDVQKDIRICDNNMNSNTIPIEKEEKFDDWAAEKCKFLNEMEKGKLQVFELEEELANKEKCIEELNKILRSNKKCLEDVTKENDKLKLLLEEKQKYVNSAENTKLESKAKSKTESTSCQVLNSLKKQLQDVSKRDHLSMDKLKHLMKKNQVLMRQLQRAKNQTNLLKVQLTGQTKMLDLLSSQYCKLEDKDRKQTRTINELENVRNKCIHMIGNLEQEVHTLKKENFEKST